MLPPTEEIAGGAGSGRGVRRRGYEIFQPPARRAGVIGIFGEAETEPLAIAELHMSVLGRALLHLFQKVRIKDELQHMARSRFALELGVGHLEGKGSER